MSDLISRQDAISAVVNTSIPYCTFGRKSREYNALKRDAVYAIKALPAAEPVDCTDFIRWIRDKVMDEKDWEMNAEAYGEVICRKLKKLGAVFSVGGYYHSAEKVHGEWVGLDECSVCGKQAFDFIEGCVEGVEYLPNFCPNCGAKMGGDSE